MQETSTDSSSPEAPIIRTGSDGRLRYSPDQRRELLEAYDRSGLSAMAFARQHGVSYQTFISWIRKRRQTADVPAAQSPAFAEVMVKPTGSLVPLRVVLPCGAAIELSSRDALPLAIELLSTLRRPC